MVTLLPLFDLLTPDFTVGLLSVFFGLEFALLLLIVLSDLIVELFSLFDQDIDFASEPLSKVLLVIFLLLKQFRVILEKSECVNCRVWDSWAQICSIHVSRLKLLKVWIVQSLECISHRGRLH